MCDEHEVIEDSDPYLQWERGLVKRTENFTVAVSVWDLDSNLI